MIDVFAMYQKKKGQKRSGFSMASLDNSGLNLRLDPISIHTGLVAGTSNTIHINYTVQSNCTMQFGRYYLGL